MYVPEDRPHDRLVIAYVDGRHVPAKFTGKKGRHGESFEISIDDFLAELYDIPEKVMLHSEDLYESTDENSERFLG